MLIQILRGQVIFYISDSFNIKCVNVITHNLPQGDYNFNFDIISQEFKYRKRHLYTLKKDKVKHPSFDTKY